MITIEERDLSPEVMDVFEASYDILIGEMYIGGYYKLAGVYEEYTARRLGANTYLSPGPCIVEELKRALAKYDRNMESAINKHMMGV